MNETVTTTPTEHSDSNTLVNALVGGIATVVLSFVPFSPVLGGMLAGYLQGTDRNAGTKVGAYAGVVASIPLALVAFFLLSVFAFVPFADPGVPAGGLAIAAVVVLFVLAVVAVYTVGLSALGGYLGAYLKDDRADSADRD